MSSLYTTKQWECKDIGTPRKALQLSSSSSNNGTHPTAFVPEARRWLLHGLICPQWNWADNRALNKAAPNSFVTLQRNWVLTSRSFAASSSNNGWHHPMTAIDPFSLFLKQEGSRVDVSTMWLRWQKRPRSCCYSKVFCHHLRGIGTKVKNLCSRSSNNGTCPDCCSFVQSVPWARRRGQHGYLHTWSELTPLQQHADTQRLVKGWELRTCCW